MRGGVMLAGGRGSTTGLTGEAALVVPPVLVAVTTTRSVEPTSALPSGWVVAVSPGSAAQEPPAWLQRSQCRLVVSASVHSPVFAVSVCPSRASPVTAGAVVLAGAAGSTSGLAAERALVVPPALLALTRTRMVEPTSSWSSVYVLSSSLASGTQLEPDPSQRCHSYANEVGEPLQVPVLALSTWPSCAVPDTTGGDTFAGGAAGTTTPVAADTALAEPPAFDAVTTTRTVNPTSPPTNTYVVPVALAMSAQLAPDGLHRRHWYANPVGEPDQVPGAAVSVAPSRAVPDTVGRLVFVGGSGADRSATSWPRLQSCFTCACALRVYDPGAATVSSAVSSAAVGELPPVAASERLVIPGGFEMSAVPLWENAPTIRV